MGASVDLRVEGDSLLLVASGEFDIVTAETLAEALEDACRSGMNVVLDVGRVSFMDATALRCFATARQMVAGTGHTITVVNASRLVTRMFRITGLADLIAV